VPEAPLDESDSGLAPTGAGWFVVNVGDAMWLTTEGGDKKRSGSECSFETPMAEFEQLGVRGASVERETSDPDEAYAEWEPSRRERPSAWDRLPWSE
jgi:hypothetical protein